MLIQPVIGSSSGAATDKTVNGVVVGVFRMGNLITNLLERSRDDPAKDSELTLYDAAEKDPDAILYDASSGRSRQAEYAVSAQIELFGRTWLIRSRSTEAFEARVATQSLNYLLGAGVLVSVLLTLLFWGQAIRYRDSRVAAQRLQSRNNRIADLMLEVNHRSKNMLGVVQAIARQTNSQDPKDFAASFSQRLGALSASQDILVKNNWTHVELEELVRSQFLHLEDLIGTRVLIEGEVVRLSAANAQTFGMAVHELTTNACKFGALSNDTGVVTIGWALDAENAADPQFRMWWFEQGGPIVKAPVRTGFGSKVTASMTEFALSGTVVRTFETGGFEWRLSCPARAIRDLPHVTPEVVLENADA